jgi:hypothetical protein
MDKNPCHVERALTAFYIALGIFWSSFIPLTILIISPDVFKFLGDLGRYGSEFLHREYIHLTACAGALLTVNAVFLIWHYRIKRDKSGLLRNKYFFALSVVGNLGLTWKFVSFVFIPQL